MQLSSENNPILPFSFIWWCSQDFLSHHFRCQVLSWFQVQRCRGQMFIHSRISWEKFPDHQYLFPAYIWVSRGALCFSQRLHQLHSLFMMTVQTQRHFFFWSGMGRIFCLVQCMTGRPVAPLLSPNAECCGRIPWSWDWRHAVEHRGSSFILKVLRGEVKADEENSWPAPSPSDSSACCSPT